MQVRMKGSVVFAIQTTDKTPPRQRRAMLRALNEAFETDKVADPLGAVQVKIVVPANEDENTPQFEAIVVEGALADATRTSTDDEDYD